VIVWGLIALCGLVVLFSDCLQQTEGQEFESYRRAFGNMNPVGREIGTEESGHKE
jgi:hypothetical protein